MITKRNFKRKLSIKEGIAVQQGLKPVEVVEVETDPQIQKNWKNYMENWRMFTKI